MTVGILSAGLVDGIALVVNEEPITLYDIDKKMLESNLSKKDAVSLLIDELLYEQELRKYNIEVDIFDVNNYIEKIRKSSILIREKNHQLYSQKKRTYKWRNCGYFLIFYLKLR